MPTPPTDALALPIPNAHFIWYCAWLTLPSAIYAYSHPASVHLAPVPASVWATSLLYWRNPIMNSWRQRIDISVVLSGLAYHTYYVYADGVASVSPSTRQIYTYLISASIASYGLGHYLWKRGRIWPATYAHAAIHIIGNIANLFFYNDVMNNY